jgi:hypothetical protein
MNLARQAALRARILLELNEGLGDQFGKKIGVNGGVVGDGQDPFRIGLDLHQFMHDAAADPPFSWPPTTSRYKTASPCSHQ